jgi:Fur family transcriptional regulator, peroxide stress response regulator
MPVNWTGPRNRAREALLGTFLTQSKVSVSSTGVASVPRAGIQQFFRERGLRCTPQRFAVLDLLVNHPGHPTAEEMFRGVNRSDPRASRATIYNSLRVLIDAGLVREFIQEGRSSRFGAHIGSHHHFLCDRCGKLEDIEWFSLKGVPQRREVGRRKVREYELVLRGVCEACSAPRRPRKNPIQ